MKHSVYRGIGGWWGRIDRNPYPFGAWRPDRGPYPFRWMALLSFPIARWTRSLEMSVEAKALIDAAVAAERERCAKICDWFDQALAAEGYGNDVTRWFRVAALQIRKP